MDKLDKATFIRGNAFSIYCERLEKIVNSNPHYRTVGGAPSPKNKHKQFHLTMKVTYPMEIYTREIDGGVSIDMSTSDNQQTHTAVRDALRDEMYDNPYLVRFVQLAMQTETQLPDAKKMFVYKNVKDSVNVTVSYEVDGDTVKAEMNTWVYFQKN